MTSISYYAWGAELTGDPEDRTRVTATREGFALGGVLLAALLPQALMEWLGVSAAMAWFSAAFVLLLTLGATVTLVRAPRPPLHRPVTDPPWRSWLRAVRNRDFRRLCAVFLLNGMAAAVPATLVVFYVEHVLDAAGWTGVFLAVYFLAGVAGMVLWVRTAAAYGKRSAWLLSMAVAIGAFAWAATLGPGDLLAFTVICMITGLALGADLALPPAMLADVLAVTPNGFDDAGSHFGLWNLLAKLSLALAAGTALPLLQALGFHPDDPGSGLGALAATYALLPCLLKLAAATALVTWPLPASGGDSAA